MKLDSIEVHVHETPLVSIDGIAEFTVGTGIFHREYGEDADPLLTWGERARHWINSLRGEFGERLRHVAVISKYRFQQFRDQSWPQESVHPLDALCVDDTYRRLIIDHSPPAKIVEKNENDATTSETFMQAIRDIQTMVLIGVTGTSCIDKTVSSLLRKMRAKEIPLQNIIIPENGVASRRIRQPDHDAILDRFRQEDSLVTVVPAFDGIRWKDAPKWSSG